MRITNLTELPLHLQRLNAATLESLETAVCAPGLLQGSKQDWRMLQGTTHNTVSMPGVVLVQALGRLPAGTMNLTEARYAAHLEQRKVAGEIVAYYFEPFNIKLAAKCFYRVDFVVQLTSGHLECHEVKGRWTDDALVKIKVAAAMYPFFRFVAIQWKNKQWAEREFH